MHAHGAPSRIHTYLLGCTGLDDHIHAVLGLVASDSHFGRPRQLAFTICAPPRASHLQGRLATYAAVGIVEYYELSMNL